MNLVETGKIIAKLRREAGYTQASLAEKLNITDKAVSKWERGICMPDISSLPILSKLLDADIEEILKSNDSNMLKEWIGKIVIDKRAELSVNNRYLTDYLISYYLLVGIKTVYFDVDDEIRKFVNERNYGRYGLTIVYNEVKDKSVMLCNNPFILLGSNITRNFMAFLENKDSISLTVDGQTIPLSFINKYAKKSETKALARGTVFIEIKNQDDAKNAEKLIRIYEKYNRVCFCDLNEIANSRGYIH